MYKKQIQNYLNVLVFLSYLLIILQPSLSHANGVVSPQHIKGTEKINAEKLIELVSEKPALIIIDSRIKSDRQQGYIETSLSLPDGETSCHTLSEILAHKKSPVIFYCNGPKCGRSAIAVKVAILCGYTNTFWFRGGFEEWKQKKFPFIKN